MLGLPESRAGAEGVPAEQAVAWHTLRPGSGRLEVALTADGPTRTVRICDREAPVSAPASAAFSVAGRGPLALRSRARQESGWLEGGGVEGAEEEAAARRREWGVRVALAGLSVSLVGCAPPAELVHAQFVQLQLELAAGPRAARLTLVVHNMQWDNQVPSAFARGWPRGRSTLVHRNGRIGSVPSCWALRVRCCCTACRTGRARSRRRHCTPPPS